MILGIYDGIGVPNNVLNATIPPLCANPTCTKHMYLAAFYG